jgi:hypothetical protein
MIKILLTFLLLFSAPSLLQAYGLEDLNNDAANHVAPKDIQSAMQQFVRSDLQDCIKQIGAANLENYFSAIEISIDMQGRKAFLVFPSEYCYAFFGAHAIAYWIIIDDTPNGYRLLYEGRSDGLEIMATYTKGMKDIQSFYGMTYIILKFDGKKYERVGGGEFDKN